MTDASTLQAFESGDVFVGATRIRDAELDDHAGDGRIIQYDRDLNAKGILWVQYVANWFTGVLIKLELSTGEVLAETQIEPKCVAGLAQFTWSSESDAQT